jgi:hypothetical protein
MHLHDEIKGGIFAYALLIHHLVAYLFAIYRKMDLMQRGKPDINGVIRAPRESLMATFEILGSSIIFGYIINKLLEMEYQ